MITVTKKDTESIEKTLKLYKKKIEKLGIVKELHKRKEYVKPSIKNKLTKEKAAYKKKIQAQMY